MERLTRRELNGLGGVNYTKCYQENCHGNCSDCEITYEAELKLKAYEDAEEQGLLLRLPCKVGDTVWAITSPINLGFDEGETLEVYKCVVESISFYNNRKHQIRLYSGGVFVTWYVRVSDFGKQVFLTKEEAEAALAKMKEGV